MGKGRLEAFSDGVIAIIITIMVLELKTPEEAGLHGFVSVLPSIALYALSFIYVGIYWNNHHHMLHAAKVVSGGVLWANLHLLFWLSLFPFSTRWMVESDFATWPTIAYGLTLLAAGLAYYILMRMLIRVNGDGALAHAVGRDTKGLVSVVLYVVGIALTFWWPKASVVVYAMVALIWLVPDRRIEAA